MWASLVRPGGLETGFEEASAWPARQSAKLLEFFVVEPHAGASLANAGEDPTGLGQEAGVVNREGKVDDSEVTHAVIDVTGASGTFRAFVGEAKPPIEDTVGLGVWKRLIDDRVGHSDLCLLHRGLGGQYLESQTRD